MIFVNKLYRFMYDFTNKIISKIDSFFLGKSALNYEIIALNYEIIYVKTVRKHF